MERLERAERRKRWRGVVERVRWEVVLVGGGVVVGGGDNVVAGVVTRVGCWRGVRT